MEWNKDVLDVKDAWISTLYF